MLTTASRSTRHSAVLEYCDITQSKPYIDKLFLRPSTALAEEKCERKSCCHAVLLSAIFSAKYMKNVWLYFVFSYAIFKRVSLISESCWDIIKLNASFSLQKMFGWNWLTSFTEIRQYIFANCYCLPLKRSDYLKLNKLKLFLTKLGWFLPNLVKDFKMSSM